MTVRELGLRSPITISPFRSTDDAIDAMWVHDIRHLLVVDRCGLVGMVADGDLLESVGMLTREERAYMAGTESAEEVLVADIMDAETAFVSLDTPMTDAAHKMIYEHRTALPVIDGRQVIGIVTESDLLNTFAGTRWVDKAPMQDQPVIHHASRVLRTVSKTDRLRKVCEKLNGSKLRHVLVVEEGRLVGIVSDWDVRMAIGRSGVGEWLQFPVTDIMLTDVQRLRPDDTLAYSAEVLRMEKLDAAPIVTRDGLLIGIITVSDLLRVFAADAVVHV